jgi:hypothetical protein
MKSYILFIFLLISFNCFCQDKIETDRPDQTESSALVPRKWFQFEFGLQREKQDETITWLHPTALWKYGIVDWLEFRLITEFQTEINNQADKIETGLRPVQLGAKIKLFEEKGLRPEAAFIFHNSFSELASDKFENDNWAPNFRFTFSNNFSKTVSVGYNLGAEWDGQSTSPKWLYTFAPAVEVSEKWKLYLESYGYAGKGHDPEHSLSGGIIFFISKDAQLDIASSVGISDAAPDHYVTAGFSFRFK